MDTLAHVHEALQFLVGIVWALALMLGTVYAFDKGIAWLLSKAPVWLLKIAMVLMLLLFIYESGAAVRNFTSWVWRRP